ncbi:hypothetical protein [Streptomyces sp. NBRC 110028]|uniref:hypothetical protein n=1 Tax=Streptomyces sp. NBRC 110028 TaxID=1621260 RepID=UPI0006E3BFA2|nr:hypothetical protein [Streptomyces sp. NBRC 110028]
MSERKRWNFVPATRTSSLVILLVGVCVLLSTSYSLADGVAVLPVAAVVLAVATIALAVAGLVRARPEAD